MTRTTLAARFAGTPGRLALVAWAVFAIVPPLSAGAGMRDMIYQRYPQPTGQLRPTSCFGYFPTQWQPWQVACPIADIAAVAVPPATVHDGVTLPPPAPISAPSNTPPVPPPAPLVPLRSGGR
jgi:hypothetical protein